MSYSDQPDPTIVSRRRALAAVVAGPAAISSGEGTLNLQQEVTRTAARAHHANEAFMRGEMDRWYSLIGPIPDDFTLMQPFGGPISRGFDESPQHLAELSRYFRKGAGTQELLASYATAEMMVLALIERQRAEVGGLPMQDWSLRVTLVFRREAERWILVHRHADPLVGYIGLQKAAELKTAASDA